MIRVRVLGLAACFLVASCSTEDSASQPPSTAAAVVTSVVSAEPTATESTLAKVIDRPVADLEWDTCDGVDDEMVALTDELEDSVFDQLECGSINVPIDYTVAGGKTLPIALTRVRGANPSKRIGSLLLNPGGPGGSGRELLINLIAAKAHKLEKLSESFDIIGFDPRGVGGSNGLACVSAATLDKQFTLDATPDTPDEVAASEALNDEVVDACKTKYGNAMLASMSTENTARDMDEIRRSVKDDKLTYLGISYGTFLGATYASMFPDRVRAMVLDGAYDPAGQDQMERTRIQLGGFEDSFRKWRAWCASSPICAFSGDTDIDTRWFDLSKKLDEKAAPGNDGRSANQGPLFLATIASLYNRDQGWPALGAALQAADTGDGSLLLLLSDQYNGRRNDGTYDTSDIAGSVINCASGLSLAPPNDKAAAAVELRKLSPHFAFESNVDDFEGCDFPEGPSPKPFAYSGLAPILVIGGKNDPATPFVWAERMTKSLGSASSLVAFTGEGHSAWMESACVDDMIHEVLVDVKQAPNGRECAPDPAASSALPTWLANIESLVPKRTGVNIDELAPLIGLEDAGLVGKLVLVRGNPADSGAALAVAIEAAGWTKTTNSTGVAYTKTIEGARRVLVVNAFETSALAQGSPVLVPITAKLQLQGPTMILIASPAP